MKNIQIMLKWMYVQILKNNMILDSFASQNLLSLKEKFLDQGGNKIYSAFLLFCFVHYILSLKMITAPDFANTDLGTLFQYLNALEMENKSRNEERVFLEGQISQLRLQLSFYDKNQKLKGTRQQQLQKQVQILQQEIVLLKQELTESHKLIEQQRICTHYLNQKVKALTVELAKPPKIEPPSPQFFLNSRQFSFEASQRSISIDKSQRKPHNQGLNLTKLVSGKDIFEEFEAKISQRVSSHYEIKSKRQIEQLRTQKDEEIKKLRLNIADLDKRIKRETEKGNRYEELYKEAIFSKTQAEQKHKQEIIDLQTKNIIQMRKDVFTSKMVKSLCVDGNSQQMHHQNQNTRQKQVYYAELLQMKNDLRETKKMLKETLAQLVRSEESKAKSRDNSYETIQTLEKIIDSKQQINTKLITEVTQLKTENAEMKQKIKFMIEEKGNGTNQKVDDLESSVDLDFPSFRDQALRIMREMQQQIEQKSYKIEQLNKELKKLRQSNLNKILSVDKFSEQREKLITAQGEIACLKAKLERYERNRSQSRTKEAFNKYGYWKKRQTNNKQQEEKDGDIRGQKNLNITIPLIPTKDSSSKSDSQRYQFFPQ